MMIFCMFLFLLYAMVSSAFFITRNGVIRTFKSNRIREPIPVTLEVTLQTHT